MLGSSVAVGRSRTGFEVVRGPGLGIPAPLHAVFTTGGIRISDTTLDYLDLCGLVAGADLPFAVLGETVLGSAGTPDMRRLAHPCAASPPPSRQAWDVPPSLPCIAVRRAFDAANAGIAV